MIELLSGDMRDLLSGDMRDLIEMFPDEWFDVIFVDPPYGQTSLAWDKWVTGWPALVRRLLKRTGSMWVCGTLRMFIDHSAEFEGWRLAQDVIWEKQNGSGFDNERFRRVHEQVAMFYRSDAPWSGVYRAPQFTHDAVARKLNAKNARVPHTGVIGPHSYETVAGGPRLMRSVIQARNLHRQGVHPTQKPVELVEPLLRYSCPQGGDVFDPFAGSGTTGEVCRSLGLNCVLIEGDEKHHAAARDRLAAA